MQIKQKFHDDCELYSEELKNRVLEVFLYTTEIMEFKKVLSKIKKEAAILRELFITEEEQKEISDTLNFFDARMQATVYYTINNLEKYQQSGWEELIYEGDSEDDIN